MDKIKYFRRHQFTLGPEYINYEGWKKYTVTERYYLSAHPDLTVLQVSHENKSITLLGYFIDPYQYELSQEDILESILQRANSIADIINSFEIMSGRFVVIVALQGHIYVFNDACGLKQVVYCSDKENRTWCATQAVSLAEKLGFPLDKEVLDYRNSSVMQASKAEFWMPNTRTPYREILHLLPNHYLDFAAGKSFRFWPTRQCISPIFVEEGVRIAATILKNTIQAASNRFDLKMSISAGIDSRKTLAATKEVRDKITYFTHAPKIDMKDTEVQAMMLPDLPRMDVKVPGKLLPKLGITHHVLEQKAMDDDFRTYYESSATWARETKGHNAYNIFHYLGPETNILNSNVSETTQCNYWLPRSKINGEGLAIATGLYHPMAIKEFDNWIKGAREACEASGLNILGLFHWEMRGGRWAAAAFSEYDIAHDSFTPYNNRYLNKVLLGINERYRRNRMWYVGLKIIKSLWPEVLSEPVNPPETMSKRIREFLRRQVLHKWITPWLPIYEYAKNLRKKMRAKDRNI